MTWGAVAGAAIVAGGTYLASENAKDAAKGQANAYQNLSELQFQRAQEAAGKVPEFRPVTVTSSFGTPQYTYDESGRLTNVGSTAAPWMAALQSQGQGMAGQYLNLQQQALANQQGQTASGQAFNAATGLYGLAGQALPQSYDVTQATQDYYNRMQQMVAPDRERQLASTRQSLFNRGRQGLATGATQAGGMQATNPEMAAYYNAIAQQDLNLANQSEQQAIANLAARQQMGLGLLSGAGQQVATGGNALNQYYSNITAAQSPYTTGMSQLSSLENMINQPVTLGMQYGGNVTNQANTIADAYIRAAGAGGQAAGMGIDAQYNADSVNPWAGAMMGAGQAIGGANWGGLFSSGSGGAGVNSASTPSGYGNSANIYYGNRPQMFSNQTGWSY
jgi:YD repeat-containing protein